MSAAQVARALKACHSAGLEASVGHLSSLLDEAHMILAALHQYAIDLQEHTLGGRSERGEVAIMDLAEDWLTARPNLDPLTNEQAQRVLAVLAEAAANPGKPLTLPADAVKSIKVFCGFGVKRKPLTQTAVVDAFCSLPHPVQFVSAFEAGVRFAERAHGVSTPEAKP